MYQFKYLSKVIQTNLEMKSVSSVIWFIHEPSGIKNTFEKIPKGILRYYLRFCFPAFLPTGLF